MRLRWCVPLAAAVLAAGAAASAAPAMAASGNRAVPQAAVRHPARIGGPLKLVPGDHPTVSPDGIVNENSGNWSGYAVTGGTFTTAKANWTLNAITCPGSGSADAAPWVGIDGAGSGTVEQTGTDSQCNNGSADYVAWYEMFPSAPVFLSKTVKAGDKFTGKVQYNGGGSYTLTLTDHTQGWTNTTTQSLQATNSSAEAILELASSQLANFNHEPFTGFTVDGKKIKSFAASDTVARMSINNGSACDKPSGLTNGASFTMTWLSFC